MPRTKSSPRKCVKSKNGQSKTWVFVGDSNILSDKNADIVKLKHPRSNQAAMFIFSADNTTVQEVFAFDENKRSWFIDESVKEDGKMHLSTPVDPIFLILPLLKRSKEEGRVMPLNDLLIDTEFPEMVRLVNSATSDSLSQVADRKGDEDLNAWMYNEEKTVNWLCKKAHNVAEVLRDQQVHVGEAAVSNTFIKSSKTEFSDDQSYLRYAQGLVAEYITDDLSEKLCEALGLPQEVKVSEGTKRKSLPDGRHEPTKRPKSEDSILDLSNTPSVPLPKQPSSKEKAKLKAASGSKSITSFFKKK